MASKLFPKHTQHLVTLSTLLQYNRCCVFQVTLRGNWNNLLDVLDLILHTPLEVHKAFAHKINALIICYIKCNVYKILNNCMKLEQYYNIHSGVRYDIVYNIWFTTLKYFKRNIMTPCYHLGPIYTSVFFFFKWCFRMKTIPVYTGVSAAFQKRSPFTLHNRKRMSRAHSCRYNHRYV